mgnify:FL=1
MPCLPGKTSCAWRYRRFDFLVGGLMCYPISPTLLGLVQRRIGVRE